MLTFKHTVLRSVIVSSLTILSMAVMTLDVRPAQAAPFVYVTNSGANTVSVIDRANNTVVKTIPVGPSSQRRRHNP